MGLIDVLTQYDTKKKAAHAAKTVKHGVSGGRAGPRGRGHGGAAAPTLTTSASVSSRLELKSPQSTPSSTPNDSVTSSPTYSCSFPSVFLALRLHGCVTSVMPRSRCSKHPSLLMHLFILTEVEVELSERKGGGSFN